MRSAGDRDPAVRARGRPRAARPTFTEMLPLRPVDSAFTVSGFTEALQLPNAWVTVTVLPATVIVPVRAADVEFTATV